MDFTIVAYKIIILALVYNFSLFLGWLILTKRDGGHVSQVYLMIMALFASRIYGIGLGLYVRTLYDKDFAEYQGFLESDLWDSRVVPELVVFLVLGVVLTRRFVKSYLFNDPNYRANNGNRKTDK